MTITSAKLVYIGNASETYVRGTRVGVHSHTYIPIKTNIRILLSMTNDLKNSSESLTLITIIIIIITN